MNYILDQEEEYLYPEALYHSVIERLKGTGDTIEDALYASGYHLDQFSESQIEYIRNDLGSYFGFEFDKTKEIWEHNGNSES